MDELTPRLNLHKLAFHAQRQAAIILDRQGAISCANQAANELLDSLADAGGQARNSILDVFDLRGEQLVNELFAAANVGFLVLHLTSTAMRKEQRVRFAVTPLKSQPKTIEYFLLVHEPVSPVSEGFAKLKNDLDDVTKEAGSARLENMDLARRNTELERFGSVAAHDLKAPLRQIAMLLGFIAEDYSDLLPSEGVDLLHKARLAADKQQEMILSLLQHAKYSAAQLSLESVDLAGALHEIQEDLSAIIEETGGRIELSGDVSRVPADPILLHQLLENLISNAFKYHSVERTPLVQISCCSRREGGIKIVVSDNGIGFDNKFREDVLAPFRRLHPSSKYEGTGIGLATCKTICERHGWRLSCSGAPNIGAEFSIHIDAVRNGIFVGDGAEAEMVVTD